MTAMTIVGIMDGLETRLKTISGLRIDDGGGTIDPPAAVVSVPAVPDYWAAFGRGNVEISPTIVIAVSGGAGERRAQRALAAYADPSGAQSVVAAIAGDPTLGGACDACVVTSFRPLGLEEITQIGYFGGLWTLTVTGSGV